jgi:hypothetical protein
VALVHKRANATELLGFPQFEPETAEAPVDGDEVAPVPVPELS